MALDTTPHDGASGDIASRDNASRDTAILGKRHDLICADGSPLEDVIATCDRVAKTNTTVLLTGETGTGKEVIARHLHRAANRGNKNVGAFIPVNCGAIPEALIEAELFGHARGAFTGAHTNRKGRVAMAEGGTLFLDEIGELPLSLQVKLLRLLQERTYEPVGDSRSVKANFRLIAATNRDLAGEVRAGRFRQDLYYRLFVCPLELPPLRSRPNDIPALLTHFWSRRGETRAFSPTVLRRLSVYPWPGNVRELENLVERLSVCATGVVIEESDLPSLYSFSHLDIEASGPIPPAPGPLAPGPGRVEVNFPPPPTPTAPTFATPTSGEGWPATDVALPWLSTSGPGNASEPSIGTPLTSSHSVSAQPPATFESVAPPMAQPPAAQAAILPAAQAPVALPPVTQAVAPPAPTQQRGVLDTQRPGPPLPKVEKDAPIDLPALLRSLEWAYIETALEQTGGNKQTAAKLLGLRRTTLVEKLRRRQKAAAEKQPLAETQPLPEAMSTATVQ